MISVSGKKWVEKKISKNSIEKIKLDLNFSEIISKLIISRNFDYNEIYSIQNPSKIQNEFKNNTITLKNLQGTKGENQITIPKDNLINEVKKYI